MAERTGAGLAYACDFVPEDENRRDDLRAAVDQNIAEIERLLARVTSPALRGWLLLAQQWLEQANGHLAQSATTAQWLTSTEAMVKVASDAVHGIELLIAEYGVHAQLTGLPPLHGSPKHPRSPE